MEDENVASLSERIDALEDLVEENLKLAKDTNRILRDLRRTGRISFWFKVILWIIVLGLPLFFIGPILQYINTATGFSIPTNTSTFGVPSAEQMKQAVTQYKENINEK